MVARALLDELTFGTISRRERPVASHVPYTRHVDDNIIKTRDGGALFGHAIAPQTPRTAPRISRGSGPLAGLAGDDPMMEQVLAPNFTFTPRVSPDQKAKAGEVFVKGLKNPPSDRVKHILATELEDLTAAVLQDTQIQRAAANGHTGDYMTHLQSKIIRERLPGLTDEEVEVTRQYLASNLAFKTAKVTEDGDKKFITLANSFVNLDDLSIDLIDSINPFQHAFEVISKRVGADVFRVIQDTIAGSRIDMSDEDALALVPQIKAFVIAHNGKYPAINSSDKNEKLLAHAQAYLTARKAAWLRDKEKQT